MGNLGTNVPANYESIIAEFNEAWNTHDPYKVVEFFTDDGYIKIFPPPPKNQLDTWLGKEQMLAFVQSQIPNFHVETSKIRIQDDKAVWNFTASSDVFKQIGVNPANGTSEAVFDGDKIKSFLISFSPETILQMQQHPPALP